MSKADRELLGQELGSSEEGSCSPTNESRWPAKFTVSLLQWHTGRGTLSKLNHLPQTDSGGWKVGVVLDGVEQGL